jgi:hypothetical protein
VTAEERDKQYISSKPQDKIEVVWEYQNPEAPTARKVTVATDEEDNAKIQPAWGNTKLASWLSKNTRKDK